MDNTYGEFQGTDLDPSLDFDFDDEEENDLLPILGLAALFASIVGGILVLAGRRREPSAAEQVQDALQAAAEAGGKNGKKAVKAISEAASDVKLGDLLDTAMEKARGISTNGDVNAAIKDVRKRAAKVADSDQLRDLLKQAQEKAREAGKRGAQIASDVDPAEAATTARDRVAEAVAGLGLVKILQDAVEKASQAAKNAPDIADTASDVKRRAEKALDKSPLSDIDTDQAGKFLDSLKERIVEAIDQVRNEVAPKAVDTLSTSVVPAAQGAAQTVAQRVKEDVIPAAQDAVERLRSDVIPSAQERAGQLADEYQVGPRARKAAEAAKSGAGTFSELLKGLGLAVGAKIVDELLPEAKNVGMKAARKAREDVIPAAADTAGQAATRVKEDVLPKVGDVASQTPGMLGDLLEMAREKVGEAMDRSQPIASEAAEAAGKAAETAKARAKDLSKASKELSKSTKDKSRGVKGAVSGAVGSAVDATTYATRETTGILFWLAALGALILLVFVPDRQKQEELWNNVRQFLGEVGEMWRDLQGPEYDELDTVADADTL
jgi:hypothetical protein